MGEWKEQNNMGGAQLGLVDFHVAMLLERGMVSRSLSRVENADNIEKRHRE